MTPRPPAFVTAAASFGPAATFIPASMTGWLILRRSVAVVRSCSRRSVSLGVLGGRGDPMLDLRGDAMLCGQYATDRRRLCVLGRSDQDILLEEERKGAR